MATLRTFGPTGSEDAIPTWSTPRRQEEKEQGDHITMMRKRAEGPVDIFDRFFGDWPDFRHRPFMIVPPEGDLLRVDEYEEGNTHIVRAEIPGLDPEHDLDVTVDNGVLHIAAEHREEEKIDEKNYYRRELRHGRFRRDLTLPEGVTDADIKATYKDGVLEIRMTVPQAADAKPNATKVPVATT
jgi:HSP20 family protein